MKTIVLFILLTGITLSIFAQDKNPAFEKAIAEYLTQQLNTDTTKLFPYSPRLNPVIPFQDSLKLPDLEKKYAWPLQNDSTFVYYGQPMYELRMPVVIPGSPDNMPVMVPDSNVHYYILQKNFGFVNPLEKKKK